MSPEAAVLAAAESPNDDHAHYVTWLAEAHFGYHFLTYSCPVCSPSEGDPDAVKRLAAEILASPEWASLPWQRDPSEVSRA
jgi:hypothetical protein